MSLLHDFENAKFSTKTILLFYVLIMPLFFISIYLFKPKMIWIIQGNPLVNLHFYFLVSVCLVLSTLWLSMIYLLSGVTMKYYQRMEDQKNKDHRKKELHELNEKIKQAKEKGNIREATEFASQYSKKVFIGRKEPRFTHHSNEHYRIMLIYSILYLSTAIAINHFWLHCRIQVFLLCSFLFVILRIPYVKYRLKQKTNANPVK